MFVNREEPGLDGVHQNGVGMAIRHSYALPRVSGASASFFFD
jgi:hypothetical protein